MKNMHMFQGPSCFGAKVCFCEAPGRRSASLRGHFLERMGHVAKMSDSARAAPANGPIA